MLFVEIKTNSVPPCKLVLSIHDCIFKDMANAPVKILTSNVFNYSITLNVVYEDSDHARIGYSIWFLPTE